ncbi:S-layer homology domain-containing protein [Paenibacillus tyrfis]|uniref:S-layer homology domain-containing protein n=1 Tax=Paenibacillus tyrfis TaxID=1501230 RepID=UPI000B596BAC|nr:S-layer homology domain-containing protein [Paenibacillus tyrfis]
MRAIRQCLAIVLLVTLVLNLPIAVLAEQVAKKDVTVLSNAFVKVTVDNHTGRFAIRTVEGQPVRKNDKNVDLIFRGDDPETSFTTFRIDGTDYIFGNPYKFAPSFFSEITPPVIVDNPDGTRQIETVWTIKGVAVKQILMLYTDVKDKRNSGNVNVRYEVTNYSGADVQVGSRILLDTNVGGNDGPAFQVGTAYKVPLQVERKLVDPSKLDPGIGEDEKALYTLPAYWVMKDKYDPSNPLATNVMAYGFNNFSEKDVNIVDEMIVGHWNRMANTKWDYQVNPNLNFTTDTNDYGTADSAVALYWMPKPIAKGASKSFETVYGLGEIIEPDKAFSIRYIDPVNQLATLGDASGYENEGVFDIVAEVENLPAFQMEHSEIEVEMQLNSGLQFVDLDERGQIKRENGKIVTKQSNRLMLPFRKERSPEEARLDIQPKFKPGETITASFKVLAQGKAWPTTREYMVTARSPETEAKLESMKDESVKAQYMASKANFVFLPAIGQASQTYAYAMSPKEVYATDVKYITLNLSNIEAYNVGNATSEPNFDLFFKEVSTGNRYRVPVKDSVILQPTGSGQVGDMRITYRTGDLVDTNGQVVKDANGKEMSNLGPKLPLGEYQVQIHYKGDKGTDPEAAGLFDITTGQRFAVSTNEAARIKKANLLAVVKKSVDLTKGFNEQLKQELETAYPGYVTKGDFKAHQEIFAKVKQLLQQASKAADPEFDIGSVLPEAKVPAYRLVAFESEEELKRFKEAGPKNQEEVLVEIQGMINRIGEGQEVKYVVDTKAEPAIINKSVAYRGKDLAFATGQLDMFGLVGKIPGYKDIPFLNTLNVKGDGTLSVASSGFVFHKGEWSLDFFNGFGKSLTAQQPKAKAEDKGKDQGKDKDKGKDSGKDKGKKAKGGEDDSLNGSLKWAVGEAGDRLNPLRQITIADVYFNKRSLFAAPSFSVSGFGLKFNDFVLRQDAVSFGGSLSMKIADSEIKNVMFNDKGFVGIDADLNFELTKSIGLIDGSNSGGGGDEKLASGEINLVHYEQMREGVKNRYDLKFDANLKNITKVNVVIEFKQVPDKRILPNVIAFNADLGDPGVLIAGATYLTGVRGAIRELADTIAGGSSDVPLTIEAGADITFGVKPATFYGSIDMTLKRSGIRLAGKMDYRATPTSERLAMLKQATVSAYWMTPWFVSASAEVDVLGWDIIIGKATIFVGQNLLKNRIDFEGFVNAKVQVPSKVPVVGGTSLGGVSLGANNDKLWGSIGILFINLGITYYFNGGIEFGTSGEGLPEGLLYLQVQDPENGPRLVVIGQGVQTLATSWESTENPVHEIEYRSVAEGVSMLDNGTMKLGLGGIQVSDEGKLHEIPMKNVTGDALLELEYFGKNVPQLVLKDSNGKDYKLVYDETKTNPQANAFTQTIADQNGETKKVYIAIPKERAVGGSWKLYADQKVESKLLNIPQTAKLDEIKLDPSGTDVNKFTASWKVSNAKPEDTVSLYLTKDPVVSDKASAGAEITAPGDAGLLIAKDLKAGNLGGTAGGVTTGRTEIDVTNVSLLGDKEDIRGMLSQGDYYLRAELKSASNFQTKTTPNKFTIIDPLAPAEVSDVAIKPAGNGYFELSFKPAAKKPAQAAFEHSYAIDVLQQANGKLDLYPHFGSLLLSEEELKPYWNAQSGKYERIRLGGWTATSSSSQVDPSSLDGKPADGEIKYTGLEVGQEYIVGVSAATKPSKEADKHENYHSAKRVDTASTLLPVPSKPKLSAPSVSAKAVNGGAPAFIEVTTNKTEQSLTLSSDQSDVEVEALYDNRSAGKADLAAQPGGSTGVLQLKDFTTDGTYAIELKARNKNTGDFSITMLYLTVDTMAPVLYIDAPLTGERTKDGKIKVSGKTSNDAALEVNGQAVPVKENGDFEGEVAVTGSDPTLKAEFKAQDRAGNQNYASVTLTNGDYQVPVGLVLRKVPNLKPNETAQVEAFLRVADGKDQAGKPQFKEVKIADADRSKLKFSAHLGEAAAVSSEGQISGLKDGAVIVKAEYKISDDLSLQAMTAVTVEEALSAYTSAVANDSSRTRVNVVSAGDLTKASLVYRVYKKSDGAAAAPKYQDDVSGWAVLPASGLVLVSADDQIAVAKRADGGKKALAVSKLMPAVLWSPTNGGGGYYGGGGGAPGGGSAAGASDVTVNNQKVAAEKKGDRLTVTISDLYGTVKDQKWWIRSQDKTVNGFEFSIHPKVLEQLTSGKQSVGIAVPFAELAFPAGAVTGLTDHLKVLLAKNGDSDKKVFEQIAEELQAKLLGGGQGVRFDIQAPQVYKDRQVAAKVALPDEIAARDITAVVLKDDNGNWTTVPWSLDVVDNAAYVKLLLTGSGSVAFISSQKKFADVDDSSWAKSTIDEAAGRLFMLGRADDRFDPDSRITRAEYPTVLLRVLGLMNQNADAQFNDVAKEDWFNRSVAIAARNGIVDGFEDGTYKPNGQLLRVEAMAMVGRSLKLLGLNGAMTESEVNTTLSAFKDEASIPAWAREVVALCIKHGVITGQDQSIHPADPLTRAQAAAIAIRLSRLMPIPNP